MNQKQMDDIFVKIHMHFKIKRVGGGVDRGLAKVPWALPDPTGLFIEPRIQPGSTFHH